MKNQNSFNAVNAFEQVVNPQSAEFRKISAEEEHDLMKGFGLDKQDVYKRFLNCCMPIVEQMLISRGGTYSRVTTTKARMILESILDRYMRKWPNVRFMTMVEQCVESGKIPSSKGLTQVEERDLLRKIAKGDQQARHKFLIAYQPLLMAAVYNLKKTGCNTLDEEDMMQEAFIAMSDALEHYDQRSGSFAAYAGKSIYHKLCDYYQKNIGDRREENILDFILYKTNSDEDCQLDDELTQTYSEIPSSYKEPIDTMTSNDDFSFWRIAEIATCALTDKQRDVIKHLHRRDGEEMKLKDYAEMKGISYEAARQTYNSACSKMSEQMQSMRQIPVEHNCKKCGDIVPLNDVYEYDEMYQRGCVA